MTAARSVSEISTDKEFYLRHNNLRDKLAKKLSEIKSTISKFSMINAGIENPSAVHIVLNSLYKCVALEEVNLAHNSLRCGGAQNIAENLKAFPRLAKLDLTNNDIKKNGIEVLIKAALVLNRDFILVLDDNVFTLADINPVLTQIRNTKLIIQRRKTEFVDFDKVKHDLQYCPLSHLAVKKYQADQAIVVAQLIERNQQEFLETVVFADSVLTKPCAIALAAVIKNNHQLRKLNLVNSHIDDDAMLAIVLALPKAGKFVLTLGEVKLSEANTKALREIATINPDLAIDVIEALRKKEVAELKAAESKQQSVTLNNSNTLYGKSHKETWVLLSSPATPALPKEEVLDEDFVLVNMPSLTG